MKKEAFGKIKAYLLIIISLALIITGVQLYQENQESKRQYKLFLNQFYFKLESAISSVDSVLGQQLEGNDLERALFQADRSLEQTALILDAGNRFVDREIYGHASLFSNHPINHFADNSTLTSEETRYLENLKKDLETIQMDLYSNETGQENPNLSIHRFNDIIRGTGLNSGFLTEHKSLAVPFRVIDPEAAPERLQKWLERNETEEQNKVFLAEGKTYVVIVTGHEQDELKQVEITDMVLKRGGVEVIHQSVQSDGNTVVIAELEEMERPFQFTAPVETEDAELEEIERSVQLETEDVNEDTGRINTQFSTEVVFELIPPKRLSKDGQIVD